MASPTSPAAQVKKVEAILSGHAPTKSVCFITTGDAQADTINGVLAVIEETQVSYGNAAIVLEYLMKRFAALERDSERMTQYGQIPTASNTSSPSPGQQSEYACLYSQFDE